MGTFNRPAKVHHLLQSGLALDIPEMHFVIIDDGSTLAEHIPGLGNATTAEVCASFASDNIIYVRNDRNIGVAQSWLRYYRDVCAADYTITLNDKDEFVDRQPILNALAKLEADPTLSLVVLPMRQRDRVMDDRLLSFDCQRMSGRQFVAEFVGDATLQHCAMMGLFRVAALRAAGVPRSLNLSRYGLIDGFGMDIDIILKAATTGDVDFESAPHIKRSTIGGATERFPLTFAYTYYQYAQRILDDLQERDFVTPDVARAYLGWWLLLIARGLKVAYRPVHGSELEPGTDRIKGHLAIPIHRYLWRECRRHRIRPSGEMIGLYLKTALIMLMDWGLGGRRRSHVAALERSQIS